MLRNKKIKLAIFFFCLIALALGGYFFQIKLKNNSAIATKISPNGLIEVNVVRVKKENVQLFLDLPARVSAYKISEVRPQIDGIIRQRKFVEGSFVKEGQQLYQVDPAIYQITLDNASASLSAVSAKRERYKNLLEQDAISKQEFDDINAALAKAQADVKKAKTNLVYTKVYAPISGYIGKSNITEGALVTANQATILTTITQLDPIYVDMAQPSRDMIKLGNQEEIEVTLIVDGGIGENKGTLKFSEVFADETTDSVRLRAIFDNKDKKLIPGMFVNAKLHLKPIEAITIPQRAANRGFDGNLVVWVVDKDNIVKSRSIKSDQISEDKWIVLDGLEEGDVIVYEGFQKISEGAKIKPVFIDKEESKIAVNAGEIK